MKARRRGNGWLVVGVVIGWMIPSGGSGPSMALGQTVWSEPVTEAAPFVEGGSIVEGDEGELADDPLDLGARLDAIERRLDEADAAKKKESAKPKLPSVTVSGVFQADAVWFDQDAASLEQFGYIENGADIRRARLGARSQVTETTNAFIQMDFGFFGRPTFADCWVEQTELPLLGNVRVGQWKQPFSLETVSSFRYTTFMERASIFQAFVPFRKLGIGFYDHSDDLNTTWAWSYFRTGQDQFGNSLSSEGGNGFAGRLTQLLWYGGGAGSEYMHVGGAYYFNSPPRGITRFRSIPEIYVGEAGPGLVGTSGQTVPGAANGTPFFVDTGLMLHVDDVQTFGLETLLVHGPLSFQAEAMAASVDQVGQRSLFHGNYSQVGYFLTGEHRPYDRKAAVVDRIIPNQSFGKGGIGAWEVAARFSHIDLTDDAIIGGRMDNLTFGVNWFINPYVKWEFNYVHSWNDGRDHHPVLSDIYASSDINAFGTRVQADF